MSDTRKHTDERVAVVIVSYNSHSVLGRCLDCVLQQQRKPNRVIVIENGERNNELEEVWKQAGVEFFSPGFNSGFAAGNNYAFSLCAECSLLALVNPDAFLAPDWLIQMCEAARSYPEAGSFASRLIKDDKNFELDGAGDAYHVSGLVWRVGHGRPAASSVPPPISDVFSACAAAALYRRSAIEEVGGFDENFFCYVEDIDLGFRLRLAGKHCLLIWAAVAYHMGSVSTGGRHSDFSAYHGHRNIEWAYFKNMPALLLVLTFPLHLIAVFATAAVLALRGQGLLVLRAKIAAWSDWRRIVADRRLVQANRKIGVGQLWRVLDRGLVPRR